MKTVTELLTDMAADIKGVAKELLLTHACLSWNPSSSGIVDYSGEYAWQPLAVDGSRVESRLRDEYSRFCALLECLLRTQAPAVLLKLQQARDTATKLINQQGHTYMRLVADVYKKLEEKIDYQAGLLAALYDGSEGEHVYVPDTNALIFNPQFEDWTFDDSPEFVLLLMPTVLSELDVLKVTGRVDSVRDKAQRLVRQLMEYRRRGDLNEGVVLRKGSHRLRTLAVEPDFGNTLPWLDQENNDDRILAGIVEVMRHHPRCPVVLVTGDINLTNKADYVRVPCVPPPESNSAAAT